LIRTRKVSDFPVGISVFKVWPQNEKLPMKKENYRIEGMTMAIKNMAQMLEI